MIVREIKLKPTAMQRQKIDSSLWQMISVYNTALTRCLIGVESGQFPSEFDLLTQFGGHSKKAGLNQNSIQCCCKSARRAVERWLFKDSSGKRFSRPHKKSARNKIRTLVYGSASQIRHPKNGHVRIPSIGKVRCSKNEIPAGKQHGGRLIKRASGYYFQYVIENEHEQEVISNAPVVGIDPGFKTLLTLSDGTKFNNPRELKKGAVRLAQAARGKKYKLIGRLQERQKMRRKDRNHKISHKIVRNYSEIYYSNDNFEAIKVRFGKSIREAGLSGLLDMVTYKAQACGRLVRSVANKNSTRGCSACKALTGPSGLSDLGVREWTCSACGAHHDRDINAAINTLLLGQGLASGEKVKNSFINHFEEDSANVA